MYAELEKILPRDSFFFDEPLKKHTTFRIGGPADVLAAPREDAQLLALLAYIRSAGLRSVIIGLSLIHISLFIRKWEFCA